MDIALNINTGTAPYNISKKISSKNRHPEQQNGFSFKFNKTDKVSATVSKIKQFGKALGKKAAFKRPASETKLIPEMKKAKFEERSLDLNYRPKVFTNENFTFLQNNFKKTQTEKTVNDNFGFRNSNFKKQQSDNNTDLAENRFSPKKTKFSKSNSRKTHSEQNDYSENHNLSHNIPKPTYESNAENSEFSLNISTERKSKPNKNNQTSSPTKTNSQFDEESEKVSKFSKNYNNRNIKFPQKSYDGEKSNMQSSNAGKSSSSSAKISSLFGNNPDVPTVGQRLVKPVNETVFSGKSMGSLNIHPHCVKNLADILDITELTTVQERAVPVILAGRDVLVRSQTGSGKTLAYGLPIIQILQGVRPKSTRADGVLALIVVPSRELAIQTYEFFVKLLKPFTWIVPGYLMGGEKRKAEKARLRRGINVLIGTPGRLCDHLLNSTNLKLDKVKWLVLDEADRLLELGYERDVRKLVDSLSPQKTTGCYDPMQQMRQVLAKASGKKEVATNVEETKTKAPKVNTVRKFDMESANESIKEEEEEVEKRGTLQGFRGTNHFIKPKFAQTSDDNDDIMAEEFEDDEDEEYHPDGTGQGTAGSGSGSGDEGNDDDDDDVEDEDDNGDSDMEEDCEAEEDDNSSDSFVSDSDADDANEENDNEQSPQKFADDKKVIIKIEDDENKNDDEATELTGSLQTILLSATLTPAVEKLAGLALKDPSFIDCSDEKPAVVGHPDFKSAVIKAISEDMVIPSSVVQSYILVPPKLRLVTLSGMIVKECRNKKGGKMLVFMATQDLIDFHFELMRDILGTSAPLGDGDDSDDEEEPLVNVEFFRLHGSMTQQERSKVFKDYRNVKSGVLFCTDVAARGLDVPAVNLVLQYSPPPRVADYVHRVGRTARAGRGGRASLFLAPNESHYIRELEDRRIRLQQETLEPYLDCLVNPTGPPGGAEGAATALQQRYEENVADNSAMFHRACKAFNSWVRFYSSFPRETRSIFNLKGAHMGHYAKSLALREPPSKAARLHGAPRPEHPVNRLTNDRNNEDKRHRANNSGPQRPKPLSGHARNQKLITSEYESGLPVNKKKKKNY